MSTSFAQPAHGEADVVSDVQVSSRSSVLPSASCAIDYGHLFTNASLPSGMIPQMRAESALPQIEEFKTYLKTQAISDNHTQRLNRFSTTLAMINAATGIRNNGLKEFLEKRKEKLVQKMSLSPDQIKMTVISNSSHSYRLGFEHLNMATKPLAEEDIVISIQLPGGQSVVERYNTKGLLVDRQWIQDTSLEKKIRRPLTAEEVSLISSTQKTAQEQFSKSITDFRDHVFTRLSGLNDLDVGGPYRALYFAKLMQNENFRIPGYLSRKEIELLQKEWEFQYLKRLRL